MITVNNLQKFFFHSSRKIELFRDFSLEINRYELVVLFGPTGCGKTTLLNILIGADNAFGGEVVVNADKSKIGLVTQHNSLFPWLNVLNNVGFGLKIKGVEQKKRNQIVTRVLEKMMLLDYKNFYPHQLSGGLVQKVSFARSIAYETELMIMDEPFSNLDFFVRNNLLDEVIQLHKKNGLTTIFVTHNPDEAVYLADRIIILSVTKPTTIVAELDVRDVKNKYSKEFYQFQSRLLKYY